MKNRTRGIVVAAGVALLTGAWALAVSVIPPAAAGGLLHPLRRPPRQALPAPCTAEIFDGAGVRLAAWQCRAEGQPRATLVFLHGVADNRGGAAGLVDRFVERQIDVVAYDSRAHGESGGEFCTYGFWEKRDLQRVLDRLRPAPVVLLGTSLGAAVALQAAADDGRVRGIVAAEVFSDLRTVARERAPRLLSDALIARAFSIAEARAAFRVDDVSPADAARRVRVPVLLIHGTDDEDTPPAHSERVFEALAGPKEMLLVRGARHNQSLGREDTWQRIDAWVENVLRSPRPPG